jgi:hypothetical protein
MKQNVYSTSVCFNENTIVACLCDCKSGCEGNGRVICVHILPIMYQITFELFESLANNILIEYANRYRTIHDNEFIQNNKQTIKQIVMTLMSACQQYEKNDDELELDVLFENFLVGTARSRNQPLPADFSQLVSIRQQNFSSSNKLAENIINHRTNIISEEIDEEIQTTTYDTYVDICKGIAALGKCCPGHNLSFLKKYVGFKILQLRATPYSIKRHGPIREKINQMKRLIEMANNENRNKWSNKKKIVLPVEQEIATGIHPINLENLTTCVPITEEIQQEIRNVSDQSSKKNTG